MTNKKINTKSMTKVKIRTSINSKIRNIVKSSKTIVTRSKISVMMIKSNSIRMKDAINQSSQWQPQKSKLEAKESPSRNKNEVMTNSNNSLKTSSRNRAKQMTRRKNKTNRKIHTKISAHQTLLMRLGSARIRHHGKLKLAACLSAMTWAVVLSTSVSTVITLTVAGWNAALSSTSEMDAAHAHLIAPRVWSWKSGARMILKRITTSVSSWLKNEREALAILFANQLSLKQNT